MRDTDNVIRKLTEDYSIPISGVTDSNKSKFKCDVQQKYCTALVEHLQRRFAEVTIISYLIHHLSEQKKRACIIMVQSLFLN